MKNLVIIFVCLFFVFGCAQLEEKGRQARLEEEKNRPSQLSLLSFRGERPTESFVKIIGEVKNTSNDKLDFVKVIVRHYDTNQQIVDAKTTFIEITSLLPGQTSPFTSISPYNPQMKTFKISFLDSEDKEIKYDDLSPAPPINTNKKK